jgi:PAS domain S-box-containing protein
MAMTDLDGRPGTAELLRAREALRLSELRLRALVEYGTEGIVLIGRDGTVLFANAAATTAFGRTMADVAGRPMTEYVHPEDVGTVMELFAEALAAPGQRAFGRARVSRADGSWRTVEGAFTNLLEEPAVGAMVAHFRDVTDALLIQQRLTQSERLEAIGRLAGGVAHDFNNLLTAIVGYTELLRDAIPEGSGAAEDLAEIEKAVARATSLTQHLLAFSRRQVMKPQVLDLNQVVEGMRRMLERLIGGHIHLAFRAGADLGRVRADPAQLEQVIMNLAVNARDAMPNGGTIVIETANRDLDEWTAQAHGAVAPGRYVLLTVTDTGHGIDGETREHIFEPFFSTRDAGTGLGLATVYGIVRQSGGHIAVDSEAGVGTSFAVFLPRVDEPLEAAATAPSRAGDLGTETVLVVEDESIVRDLAARVLRQRGYTVLTAADGDDAIAQVQRYAGPIALVVSDVVMPGLTGPQTVERLQALRPGLRALLMSGYTADETRHIADPEAPTPFLAKPFSPWSLTAKVREILDAPAP